MADDRLKGWKEIAEFLHVGDRTAQRWEHSLGLPVHRLETARSVIVFASRTEVQAWLESAEGKQAKAERPVDAESPSQSFETAPTVRRRTASWGWTRVAAVAVLLSAFLMGTLAWWKSASKTGVAGSPRVGHAVSDGELPSPASLLLRLTLIDGRIVTIGVTPGVLATCALSGRAPYALTTERVHGAMRVHIYRVSPSKRDGNQEVVELAAVTLDPGGKLAVRGVPDIVAVEYAAPPPGR